MIQIKKKMLELSCPVYTLCTVQCTVYAVLNITLKLTTDSTWSLYNIGKKQTLELSWPVYTLCTVHCTVYTVLNSKLKLTTEIVRGDYII